MIKKIRNNFIRKNDYHVLKYLMRSSVFNADMTKNNIVEID